MKFRLRSVTILLAAILLLIFYYPVIFHPSEFIFSTDGDGLKYWYFMKYHIIDVSASFTEFRGMNYPFTESIYNLDAQPALLFVLKWINTHVINITENFMVIIYFLVFFSLLISSLLILEIFFHYGMLSWLAIPFTLGITFMSPQLHRIYTHINLAYAFVLPLTWWLYLKFTKTNKKKFLFALIFFLILSGFLHPYYIAIEAVLLFILILIERNWNSKNKWKYFLWMIIVPLISFFIVINAGFRGSTDLAKLPYGAFGEAYRSRPEDVFTPNNWSFWYDFLNLHWIHHGSWEGEAYIGFAMLLPGLSYLFYFLINIFRKEKRKKLNPFKTLTGLFLFPMLLFIITAGAFHFILPHSIKEMFPTFLTQFRTFGRLAWVIFYMLSIFFSIKFFLWLRLSRIRKRKMIYGCSLALFFLLYAADVVENNLRVMNNLDKNKISQLNFSVDSLAENISPGKYQAIIALPYFNVISSLPFSPDPFPGIMFPAFELSLKTMLPLTDINSSRTSQSLSRKQIRLYSHNDKEILRYMPSKKPFLIIINKENMDGILDATIKNADLFKYQKNILKLAKPLNHIDNYYLFEISFQELLLVN
ncbi:MAG TPA: hypothetical protein VJY62_20135 [Bacteroidia bacterium]|nr:hypothetical protein [Bacteroidia bacterium]